MIFRPLTLAAAVAGSIGLSSAEINYAYVEGDFTSTQTVSGDDPSSAAVQLASKIASPVSKDLIIHLSSEINLVTQTEAKGTNKGGKDTSEAEVELAATLKYCVHCPATAVDICNGESPDVHTALPGRIVFAARRQTLSVDVNLDCNIEVANDPEATCEVTGYVAVDLELDTTAAHSFNFIADLANTGTGSTNKPVQVVACFDLTADAAADAGSAEGHVSLGSTMLIVEEAQVSNFN